MASLREIASASPESLNISQALITLAKSMQDTNESLDAFFLSTMGILVYFMQAGFAFLEAGSVRSKGVTNILIKNALDAFLGGVAFYAVGWALAYGEPANRFCGTANWFLVGMPDGRLAQWFYEYVFAASAATIVSGALAERCNFAAYLIYSVIITGIVYPIIAHWVWSSDGWLAIGITAQNGTLSSGFHDFAGSGAVHATGGIASLVGAALLGPRLHRFHPETGKPQPMPGHSVPHVALGAFILYFTFLAFNGGSQITISNPGDGLAVAIVMVNTILACCCGGAAGLVISRLTSPHWSFLETINCSLAGTVAICSGCNVVYPWGACAIGVIGAVFYTLLSRLVLRLGIDDPASSVAVHYGGGCAGVLSVAFFHRKRGILLNWNQQSGLDFAVQLLGLLAITLWSGGLSCVVFGALKFAKLLRVSEEFELRGVDLMKHGEPAYPEDLQTLAALDNRAASSVSQEIRPNGALETSNLRARNIRRRISSGMLYEDDEGLEAGMTGGYTNATMSTGLVNA